MSAETEGGAPRNCDIALGGALTFAVVLTGSVVLGLSAGAGGIRAAWHANLGAVEHARRVLSVYDPERRRVSLVELRRDLDLSPALARYRQALAHDPRNPTARQRLAMVDLARGAFDAALTGMEALWRAGHRDRVTRLLYSDALVAAGRVDEAGPLVEDLPFANARLLGHAWTYRQAGDLEREAYARDAAARVPARARFRMEN